jgi:methylmalonyl-CoA mutase
MLVVKMGQDGHDRGAKVIATAFADIGFDVDVGPLFQTPEEAAQDAIDNDVHVVGISSARRRAQDAGAQAVEALKAPGRGRHPGDLRRRDPAAGLRVPQRRGVKAIFGPGTNIPDAAREILLPMRSPSRSARAEPCGGQPPQLRRVQGRPRNWPTS